MNGFELEGEKLVVEKSSINHLVNKRDRPRDRPFRGDRDSSRGDYFRKRGPNPDDKCFNCGKRGHWSNECKEKKSDNSSRYRKGRRHSRSKSGSRSRSKDNSRSGSRSGSRKRDIPSRDKYS